MAEKIVEMTKKIDGKTHATKVVESSFEKVWSKRGWKLKTEEKVEKPSTSIFSGGFGSSNTE